MFEDDFQFDDKMLVEDFDDIVNQDEQPKKKGRKKPAVTETIP